MSGNETVSSRRRSLLVILVWVWSFIGAPIIAALIACIRGVPLSVNSIMDMFYREPYLASYIEFICDGGLPLAITIAYREGFEIYGLRKQV